MPNGTTSNPCSLNPSNTVAPRPTAAWCSTPSFMCSKAASRGGCCPKTFPPWKTVYHVFRAWRLDGTWAALNDTLRVCVRADEGRAAQPSAAILDSQSVKSDGPGGAVGYDAGKKIKGRKRHLLVDTLGLVLGVIVTPAAGSNGCASSGWTAATRANPSPSGCARNGPNWQSRWSNVRRRPRDSRCCRAGGSPSAPLAGSCATAGSCVTMSALRPPPKHGFTGR